MVLAGNMAQLPPAGGGKALYSDQVVAAKLAFTNSGQQATLGKAIWHMFMMVVILRQNMHQHGLLEEDKAFCTALAHMYYAHCTMDDVQLLKSRVVLTIPPKFNQFLSLPLETLTTTLPIECIPNSLQGLTT